MKCDNCSNKAAYTHSDAGLSPAYYCVDCLPVWMQERANAGHFPLVSNIKEEKKSRKAAEPVEEVAVEDN
jgi:hypothetical protein